MSSGQLGGTVLATVGRRNELFSMGNSQKSANSCWTSTAENTVFISVISLDHLPMLFSSSTVPFPFESPLFASIFQLAVKIFQKEAENPNSVKSCPNFATKSTVVGSMVYIRQLPTLFRPFTVPFHAKRPSFSSILFRGHFRENFILN